MRHNSFVVVSDSREKKTLWFCGGLVKLNGFDLVAVKQEQSYCCLGLVMVERKACVVV